MDNKHQQSDIERRVFEICDRLSAKGEKLSTRVILAQLDDVKSTSTVHKPFSDWKNYQAEQKRKYIDNLKFSDKLAEAFFEEISNHKAESERRAIEQAHASKEQIEDVIEDLQRAEAKCEKLEALNNQEISEKVAIQKNADEQVKAHTALIDELRTQLSEQTKTNKDLIQANELLRVEIAKSSLKVESLESDIEQVQSQNKILVSENKNYNATISTLKEERAGHIATIKGLNDLNQQNEKLIQQLQVRIDQHQQQHTDLTADYKTISSKLERTEAENGNLKERLSQLQDNNAELMKSLNEQREVISQFTKKKKQ